MVIVLSSAEHLGLFNARKKSNRGSCRRDCVLKGDMWPSCDVLSRPALEFSNLMQSPNKRTRKYYFSTLSSIQSRRRRPQAVVWSRPVKSWVSLSLPTRDRSKRLKCLRIDSSTPKEIPQNDRFSCNAINTLSRKFPNYSDTFPVDCEFTEEPWLLQSLSRASCSFGDSDSADALLLSDSGNTRCLKIENLGSEFLSDSSHEEQCSTGDIVSLEDENEAFLVEYSPVEEPWLIQSSSKSPSTDIETVTEILHVENSLEPNETLPHSQLEEEEDILENFLIDGEEHETSMDDLVSTKILINSSICTMQRIAVLEDGKLVELLLEPVKNNVQCDSVYLGVVTKLVPHMGGAFVNIGGPRASLMDIKPRREPFIFPPFLHQKKEKVINGSVPSSVDLSGASDIRTISDEIEEIDFEEVGESDEDSEEFVDDDELGEKGTGEKSDPLKSSNGSVANDAFDFSWDGHLEKLSGYSLFKKRSQNDGVASQHDGVASQHDTKWSQVQKGTKVLVQVVKEGLGAKAPLLTAYPKLRSRFWVLMTCCSTIGISKKISGVERTRLKVIAASLQPPGFGLTVRTVAAGHSMEELQKDLEKLLCTWKGIIEHAKSAALAADEGVNGAVPVILHQAMKQTLSVVQDYFNDRVESMIVDSPRTYHEVTNYLQEMAPNLCDRVELYGKRTPLFDEYKLEEEINSILIKRVPLDNGGYLVIEQTEALVSIDVNGGQCMLGQGTSQEKAILDVNLAAAKQIARELRLRDVGGIIVVDFIDMQDDSNKRLVYEEVKKAVERDRSMVKVSELSKHGLMEITRKRVRPSVSFMISEPCTCCSGTGRVEALETSFSKIEHEICRLLSMMDLEKESDKPNSWPRFVLRVDQHMSNYLTSGKRTKLAILSSSLKVWILLKVVRGFSRGAFELKPLVDDNEFKRQHQSAVSILQPTSKFGGLNSRPTKKVTLFPIKKWKTGRK